MISISTIIPNDNQNIVINEYKSSSIRKAQARVSRVKTLDGGVFTSHRGFSEEDRTLTIKARLSQEKSDILWNLFASESILNISILEGFFSGAIQSLEVDNGSVNMAIFIIEKLN